MQVDADVRYICILLRVCVCVCVCVCSCAVFKHDNGYVLYLGSVTANVQ